MLSMFPLSLFPKKKNFFSYGNVIYSRFSNYYKVDNIVNIVNTGINDFFQATG